ncbi:hypothetical protein BT69DRAFT_1350397 [Atractiella rhizophila]|nr:hypothetical protein BT69DRAFT_1350397 [Atractiella rhizophila]
MVQMDRNSDRDVNSEDEGPESETFDVGSQKEKERQKLLSQVHTLISKKKKTKNQERDAALKARAQEQKKSASARLEEEELSAPSSSSKHLDPSIFSAAAASSSTTVATATKKRKRHSSDTSKPSKKRRATGKPRVNASGEVIGNTTIQRLSHNVRDGVQPSSVSPASKLLVRRALFKKKPMDIQLRGRSNAPSTIKAGLALGNGDGVKRAVVIPTPGGINGSKKLGVPKKFASSTYD